MPIEHKKFESVDRTYKQNMLNFVREPKVWDSIDNDKIK